MEFQSRHLKRFFDADNASVELEPRHPRFNFIPVEIVARLQRWISAPESQLLWVMGRPFSSKTSDESIAAAYITTLIQSAEISCISFFCQQHETSNNGINNDNSHDSLLISLLYSLTRQLTLLVPESFNNTYDYHAVLTELDGTQKTIHSTLDLIRRLLGLAPNLLFCVIDGLHLLDRPSTTLYIKELLEVLQIRQESKVLKVLIVTSGFITSAARLDATARLDCSRTPRRKPGRSLQGLNIA